MTNFRHQRFFRLFLRVRVQGTRHGIKIGHTTGHTGVLQSHTLSNELIHESGDRFHLRKAVHRPCHAPRALGSPPKPSDVGSYSSGGEGESPVGDEVTSPSGCSYWLRDNIHGRGLRRAGWPLLEQFQKFVLHPVGDTVDFTILYKGGTETITKIGRTK